MANAVTDARAKLIEAIDDVVTSPEDTPFQHDIRGKAWKAVEKAIDFFENTVDEASWVAAVDTTRATIAREEAGL